MMSRNLPLLILGLVFSPAASAETSRASVPETAQDSRAVGTAVAEFRRGRHAFRRDTFGNQAFWGGQLRLHEALAGRSQGGKGAGLSPKAALEIGLKVDANALPANLKSALRRGDVDLDSTATTRTS